MFARAALALGARRCGADARRARAGRVATGCQNTVELIEPLVSPRAPRAARRADRAAPATDARADAAAPSPQRRTRATGGAKRQAAAPERSRARRRPLRRRRTGARARARAVAARAGELDAEPRFPREDFASLLRGRRAQLAADRSRCDLVARSTLIRARRGRRRLDRAHPRRPLQRRRAAARCWPPRAAARAASSQRVAAGELLLGVWGADPAPGEGEPARIERAGERRAGATRGQDVLLRRRRRRSARW